MNRLGQIAVLGEFGEVVGVDGPVAADTAAEVERWLPGFAVAALLSTDQRSAVVGIGVEPDHREVSALVCCLGASSGLVFAGWARARSGYRCTWIGDQDLLRDRRDVHALVQKPIDRGARHFQHVGDLREVCSPASYRR